jgi:hypothetical protein
LDSICHYIWSQNLSVVFLLQFSFIILPKRVCNPQNENLWYWHFLPPKLYHMTTIKINKPEVNKSNTHDCQNWKSMYWWVCIPIFVANKVQLLLLSDKISEPKQESLHSPRHIEIVSLISMCCSDSCRYWKPCEVQRNITTIVYLSSIFSVWKIYLHTNMETIQKQK